MNTNTEAVAHDTKLIEMMQQSAKLAQNIGYARSTAASMLNLYGERGKRASTASIIEGLQALVDAGDEPVRGWSGRTPSAALAALNTAIAAEAAHDVALRAHDAAYTGWNRFFLVTSSDGLLHRSMNCSTCNKGRSLTTFALFASLSGCSVDSAVEVLGPSLCSVCFPTAPASWLEQDRVPAKLAMVLFEKGEAAFIAARDEHVAAAAKRAAGRCAGSGQIIPAVDRKRPASYRGKPYAICPCCGGAQSITNAGKLIAHNPRKD